MANIINMSNPRGADFSSFSKNQILPNVTTIYGRVSSLKNQMGSSNESVNVVLNDLQRAARDIVQKYAQEWVVSREGEREYPKPLRFF